MEDDKRKHSLFDVPLPGMNSLTVPSSQPASDSGRPKGAEDVVTTQQIEPLRAVESELPLKLVAQQSRRFISVSQTEQHEQISINVERGPAMQPANPTPQPASPARDVPPSVTPVYADQPQVKRNGELPLVESEGRSPWAWLPTLGFASVGAAVLIVSLLILQEPLMNWTQAKVSEQSRQLIAAQQQADYRMLDADIRGVIRQIDEQIGQVDLARRGLVADAEIQVGQPLQYLRSKPQERPRELDRAILQSREVAADWATLVNIASDSHLAESVRLAVQELHSRMDEGRLVPADRERAAGLLALISQQQGVLAKRNEHLQRLTESLEVQRFEKALNTVEGRK